MGQVGLEPTMWYLRLKAGCARRLATDPKNGSLLSCRGTGGGLVRKFGFPSLTNETNISGMGWLVNGPWASWSAVPPVGGALGLPKQKEGGFLGPPPYL
jgi:hypothetical protein